VLFIRKPSAATLDRLLADARRNAPTYAQIGATNEGLVPEGYRSDSDSVSLGRGGDVFEHAVAAVRRWQAQRGAGVEVSPSDATVVEGETTLLLIRALGLWTVAPCRVLYVQEQPDRFAFAYATLPGHPEEGEASFVVARLDDGEVQFRVASFSRPVDLLARIARPLTRRIQRRITLKYLAAIEAASR
jgi:uncharacterized protein (UPF0548 family)